jgi:hypothetical protein
LVFKPRGRDLNIWGKTDAGSSDFQIGCTQLFNPAITGIDDPLRYYPDPAVTPTNAEVLSCLNTFTNNPYNNTINDYTPTFTGTTQPSFITVI